MRACACVYLWDGALELGVVVVKDDVVEGPVFDPRRAGLKGTWVPETVPLCARFVCVVSRSGVECVGL